MNFFISIVGWFLWNWGELEIRKRELDDDGNPSTNFSFSEFKGKKWTTWIGSLFMIPVLLWIGIENIDLHPFEPITGITEWSNLYYLGAGFAWEAVLFAVVFIKNRFKK